MSHPDAAEPGSEKRSPGRLARALRGLVSRHRFTTLWGTATLALALASWCFQASAPALPMITLGLALGAGVVPLFRYYRRLRGWLASSRHGALAESVLVTLFFATFTWRILGFVIRQGIPVDRGDHHIMIARAELLTRALREGRVVHWSHLFQGGDTLIDLYPVLLNWVTAVIHLASPAGTPFVKSYSLLCVMAWGLRGAAVYALSRRFAGPVIALLIAVGSLFEIGTEVFDGIWNGVFYWGMIHNNLALSFAMFATALQVDLMRRVTTPRIVACAALYFIATCAHPLGMLYAVISAATATAATLLVARRKRRGLWAISVTGLGIACGAIWVLPYVNALSQHGFNGSVPGIGYSELGNGLFNGRAPITSFGALVGLSALALSYGLFSRRSERFATSLLALFFLLLALSPFMVQSRALEAFPSFLDAQQRRAITVLKTALVPCLAILFSALVARPRRFQPSALPGAVLARALVFALLALGPARAFSRGAEALRSDLHKQFPVPPTSKFGARENDSSDDHREALNWIARQRREDPSPVPWRMTYADRFDAKMHAHWFWVQGLNTGVPLVDYGWVSANFLRYRPREFSSDGFRDWNIRYVMSLSGKAPASGLELRKTVGPYRIWEVSSYDPRFVVAPDGVEISGLRVTDDVIEFDVSNAPAAGVDVTVRCAWFPRWRATEGGRALPVRAVSPRPNALPGQDQLGLRVQKGHVVLRADATMPRFWAGAVVSVGAFGMLALVASLRRRTRVEESIRTLLGRLEAVARTRASRLKGRKATLALTIVAVLGLLLLFVARRGYRVLLTPPIEGFGMTVQARSGQKSFRPCAPDPWYGRYTCKDVAMVEPDLGITPVNDNSGEYGKLWPGMRLSFSQANTELSLRFPAVDASRQKLVLRVSTGTPIEVGVEIGAARLGPSTVTGNTSLVFELPPGLAKRESAVIKVRSQQAGTSAVLRGELVAK